MAQQDEGHADLPPALAGKRDSWLALSKPFSSSTPMKKSTPSLHKISLEETYPAIAEWIDRYGWIELGQDDYSESMVRVLDPGGLVWESKKKYRNLDELFEALEKEIVKQINEIG